MNERKLSKAELKKREDIIMNMKDNKRDLVKKYGKDAEAVMYGRATNMAKKQTKEMRDPNLTELIKDALKNPKKADLNKDGKLSDYEEKRGAAIEKNIKELDSSIPLEKDFTYDYEDIGQFYLEGFGRPHSLNNSELEALGKQIVDRLYGGNISKAYDDLKNRGKMNEVELPTSIIQKFANEIKDPQGFAKAMLGIFNSIQDKEQKDYSKNQKFGRVLSYLKDIADDEAKEINEAPGSTLDLSQDDMDKLHQSGKLELDGHKLLYKVKEDIDLGHEDNEPGMLQGDLYQIGKASMELYKILDQFEGMGEVDLPSWWQSKIFKAKEALVGAQEYLEFELKEPQIDAVVDVATDVVDEEIGQLGTDDDTGFQASLYTPNELGDVSVGREYASGAFEENKKPIKENMNYNKWRRAFNGKNFAMKTILLEDYSNNKKRYAIRFTYNETPRADVVSVSEVHFGGHEGSGMPFSLSNMQTKPRKLFSPDDKFEWDNEEEFEKFLESGSKGLENLLSFFLGGKFADDAIEDYLETGVYKIVKIKEAEYIPSAAVNENKSSKHSSIAEKLAKELKEGLPKGFWDKKMDAEDEVKEEQGMDPERFVGSGGDEIDSDNISNVTKDNPAQDAEIGFGLEEDLKGLMAKGEKMAAFANKQSGYEGGVSSPVRGVLAAATVAGAPDFNGDEDLKAYWTRRLTKAIETQKGKKYMSGFSVDESYDTLVNKIKKQGKSAKAAKAIAGAVASYKAKGGGKGPTAKQK